MKGHRWGSGKIYITNENVKAGPKVVNADALWGSEWAGDRGVGVLRGRVGWLGGAENEAAQEGSPDSRMG